MEYHFVPQAWSILVVHYPNGLEALLMDLIIKESSFSFLIDFKLGHKMMSGTNFNAVRHGLHKITLPGRDGGVVGVGVNEQGETNTVAAGAQTYWEVVRSQQLVEPIVYDAGYWRLRQITVGYDLTKLIPSGLPVTSVVLNIVANNVALLEKMGAQY